MIDLRNYGFEKRHQHIYDMAWHYASDGQQALFLSRLLTGIGALGLTEPGAGSDALGPMKTTALRDGDHFEIGAGTTQVRQIIIAQEWFVAGC
jgi:hypothetical protein